MNRRTFIASLGATWALAILGGVLPARALAQAAAPGSADTELAAIMDRIFFHVMDTNPEFATALGLDTGPRAGLKSQLSDYSPASQGRQLAAFKSAKMTVFCYAVAVSPDGKRFAVGGHDSLRLWESPR